MSGEKTNSGKNLSKLWRVSVAQAYYHKDGNWFMPFDKYPAGLFDPNGYVIFRTQEEYENCTHIEIGQRVHVPKGISSIPGYKKMR